MEVPCREVVQLCVLPTNCYVGTRLLERLRVFFIRGSQLSCFSVCWLSTCEDIIRHHFLKVMWTEVISLALSKIAQRKISQVSDKKGFGVWTPTPVYPHKMCHPIITSPVHMWSQCYITGQNNKGMQQLRIFMWAYAFIYTLSNYKIQWTVILTSSDIATNKQNH